MPNDNSLDTFKKAREEFGSSLLALCYFFFKAVINTTMISVYRLFGIPQDKITLHHAEKFLVYTTLILIVLIIGAQYIPYLEWVVIILGNIRIMQILSINLMTILFNYTPTCDKAAKKRSRWHFIAVIFSLCDLLLIFAFMYACFDYHLLILNQHFDEFFSYLYFATVTLATVGFGDIFPVTVFGRFLTIYQILVDICLLAFIFIGAIDRFQKQSS